MTKNNEEYYLNWSDIYNNGYLNDSLCEYIVFVRNLIKYKKSNNTDELGDIPILKSQYETILSKLCITIDEQNIRLREQNILNYKSISQTLFTETIQYFVFFLCCKDLAILNDYIVKTNSPKLFEKLSSATNNNNDVYPDFYLEIQNCANKFLKDNKFDFLINSLNPEKQKDFINAICPIENYFDKYHQGIGALLYPERGNKKLSDSENEMTNLLLTKISNRIADLINERIKKIAYAIIPEFVIENTRFIAVGDGSTTTSLYTIANLGLILFSYKSINKNESYTEMLPIFQNAVIHITTFGYEEGYTSHFSLSINNKTMKFVVNKKFSFYKPKIGNKHVSGLGDFFEDEKNVKLKNKINETELKLTISPACFGKTGIEECMFVISVTNPEPRSKEDITLTISKSDTFDNDKFEVEKDKIDGLFRDKIEQKKLLYLIDLLKEADETNQWSFNTPSLCGKFVGTENKYAELGEPKITADIRYIPTNETIENKSDETDISQERAYRDLRYSYFKLTTNVEEKKIDIEIESFVSPLISRLDKAYELLDYRATQDSLPPDFELPAESKIPTSCINELTLQNYKVEGVNWHADNPQTSPKIEIPSYNQALAMLRSFGLLEAFVIRIRTVMEENMSAYSQEEYERVISKLRNLLVYQAVSYDKTAEARGIDTKYQLSENQCVTYGLYQSLKWYCYPLQKQEASPYQYDYERYYRFEW